MTTRRNVTRQEGIGEKDDAPFAPPAAGEKSNIAPAVPSSVIYKLLSFTVAMFALPIGTYFMTVNTVFNGNSTWAGALAAILANVVLISYVIVAFKDDQSEREAEAAKENRKSR